MVKEEWGGKCLNHSSVQVQATASRLAWASKGCQPQQSSVPRQRLVYRGQRKLPSHVIRKEDREPLRVTRLREREVPGHKTPICRWSSLVKSGTWEGESGIKELWNKVCFYKWAYICSLREDRSKGFNMEIITWISVRWLCLLGNGTVTYRQVWLSRISTW